MNRDQLELELAPTAAATALAEAAADVDARWEPGARGGRLTLPVVYGLRHGVAVVDVELERLSATRTRLVWQEAESRLQVHRSAVAILSFAVVPLVVTVAWPFYLPLFALVPFAAVTGLVAWWLVVSRLRSSGPREFFEALATPPVESSEGPIR
jgi:hypothetical protein